MEICQMQAEKCEMRIHRLKIQQQHWFLESWISLYKPIDLAFDVMRRQRERESYQTIIILLKWYLNCLKSIPLTSINVNPCLWTISGSDWRNALRFSAVCLSKFRCYDEKNKMKNAHKTDNSEMQLKYCELPILFLREYGGTRAVDSHTDEY